MICPKCEEDRNESDFIRSEKCYKCVYQEKLDKVENRKGDRICKICGEICDVKRWSYCSDKCARDGKRIHDKNYWTTKLKNNGAFPAANSFNFCKRISVEEE